VPKNGDLIVWNTNFGGGAGHIAIVTDAKPSNFEVLEQNAGNGDGKGDDDKTKLSRYGDYSNVMGWLRIVEPDPNYEEPQKPVEIVNPCQNQDNKIVELNSQNDEKNKTIENLKRDNTLLSTEKIDIQFNLNAKEKIIEKLEQQILNFRTNQDEDLKKIQELKDKLSTEIKDKKDLLVEVAKNEVKLNWSWTEFIIGQLRSGTLPAIVLSTIGTAIYFIIDKLAPSLSETIRDNYPMFASTYLLPIVGLIIKNLINLVDKPNK
jgi:hypothetical protein